jgi:hypothetical protein
LERARIDIASFFARRLTLKVVLLYRLNER